MCVVVVVVAAAAAAVVSVLVDELFVTVMILSLFLSVSGILFSFLPVATDSGVTANVSCCLLLSFLSISFFLSLVSSFSLFSFHFFRYTK